ncbi:MAG: hypothetical protein V4850_20370 [Myxococcota bacterium]
MTTLALLPWLLACAEPWTEAGALAPTWKALDSDQDGRLEQAEYEAHTIAGASFTDVDIDQDGALSLGELDTLFVTTDPGPDTLRRPGPSSPGARTTKSSGRTTTGGKRADRQGAKKAQPLNAVQERKRVELEVRLVLESLVEEVRYADPARIVPDATAVTAAVHTGSVHTAASRALLAELEQAATDAHLSFPPSLSARALAGVPVVDPLPPLAEIVAPERRPGQRPGRGPGQGGVSAPEPSRGG